MSYTSSAGSHRLTFRRVSGVSPERNYRLRTWPIACFSSSESTLGNAKTAAPIAETMERRSSADHAPVVTVAVNPPARRDCARSGPRRGRSPAMIAEPFSPATSTSGANDAANTTGQPGRLRLRDGEHASRRTVCVSTAESQLCVRQDTASCTGLTIVCDSSESLRTAMPHSGTSLWLKTFGVTTRARRWHLASISASITVSLAAVAEIQATSITASGATGSSTHSRAISPKLNSWSDAKPWRRGSANGQRPVPHDSDAPERAVEHLLLRLARVCPAPVRHSHIYRIAHVIENTWTARRDALPSRPEGRSMRHRRLR
jgi:hypothetical protein